MRSVRDPQNPIPISNVVDHFWHTHTHTSFSLVKQNPSLLDYKDVKKMYIREIKNGKNEKLRKWGKELYDDRKLEVLESLRSENVEREFAYVARIAGKDYFIAFMESKKEILPADMNMPINKQHVEILKECLEKPELGELLYDFEIKK